MTQSRYARPSDGTLPFCFWGGLIMVLALGLLFGVYAGLRALQQWGDSGLEQAQSAPPALRQAIRVVLRGADAVMIDPAAIAVIRQQTEYWLAQHQARLRERLHEDLRQRSQRLFAVVQQRIPLFADWYYSLGGEYGRLFAAVFGDLPSYVAAQWDALVFTPADSAQAIEQMSASLDRQLREQLQGAAVDFQATLARLARAHRLDVESPALAVVGVWAPTVGQDGELPRYLALSGLDLARQSAASGAGAAVGALTAKKLGAATVAKIGLKSALKTGGALGGAASGAALCIGSGVGAPFAPGCALLGGVLTGLTAWLGVDKGMLEMDEWWHRERLEEQLRVTLERQREALVGALAQRYDEALMAAFEQFGRGLRQAATTRDGAPLNDFVPAAALRAR
jgi:hypothetical protein